METDDFYWLALSRDEPLPDPAPLKAFLARLATGPVPKPAELEVPAAKKATVAGWTDAKVIKAIDNGKDVIGLRGTGVRSSFSLTNRFSLALMFRLGPSPDELRALFLDSCEILSPTYARLALRNHSVALFDKHYALRLRTFDASGLYWLNFFGPEEEARQGGAALANNEHATVRRLPNGLLIEVGTSPFDALTPEGEAKLLAATHAMPPMPPEPPQQAPTPSDAEHASESEAAPAPITVVDGVRGFLREEHTFWVTKHIEPPHPLSPKTVKSLAALVGKQSPKIERVNVLFSGEEAARVNKDQLDAVNVGSWYVSLEDGMPRST